MSFQIPQHLLDPFGAFLLPRCPASPDFPNSGLHWRAVSYHGDAGLVIYRRIRCLLLHIGADAGLSHALFSFLFPLEANVLTRTHPNPSACPLSLVGFPSSQHETLSVSAECSLSRPFFNFRTQAQSLHSSCALLTSDNREAGQHALCTPNLAA